MRHAEALRERPARGVDVDAHDLVRADQPGTLDDVEPDAAEAEHDDVGPGLDPGGVDDGPDAGRDGRSLCSRPSRTRVLADLRERNLRQHREVRERGATHVVMDLFAAAREAARPSGITPWPCVARIRRAGFVLRERHDLHCRHSGV